VIDAARYAERRRRVAGAIEAAGLDGFVATPGPDLRYLTGYEGLTMERPTLLRLLPIGDPLMLVPRLELPSAQAAAGIKGVGLEAWADGEDPYGLAARMLPPGRHAITDQTWAALLLGLQEAAPDAVFVASGTTLPGLRAVKDAGELDAMTRAGAAVDAAFDAIRTRPFSGRTEHDVARELAELLRGSGHDRVEFTIVGSGPNGASPHHDAGPRRIGAGESVVLDFGGFVDGYGSDLSRTVVVGDPPTGFDEVYAAVRAAQQAAFEAVRPGVACQDVDRAARAVIEDAGFGELYLHRTGHGIGLETHEDPYIVEGNETPLREGMTFSIEPGVYVQGRFGARIEDILAVTANGARRLNEATRDVVVVA
jgi:D-alanyl-D-alanine dipeptidase